MHLSLTDPAAFEKERAWRRELDRHVQGTAALAGISSNDLPLPTSSWDWECLRSLISTYERARGRLVGIGVLSLVLSFVLSLVLSLVRSRARQGDYGIRHAATFASLCAHGVNEDALLSHLAALPTRDLIH